MFENVFRMELEANETFVDYSKKFSRVKPMSLIKHF